jgi:uncharacterized protein YlxW (UPF0749 family)
VQIKTKAEQRPAKPHQKQLRQNIFLFILLFLFGVIVTNHITQVNQNRENSDLSDLYVTRQSELDQAIAQYDSLVAENERLLQSKEAAITQMLNQQGYSNLLDELNRVKALGGLTTVTGPGVAVTLNDKPNFDVLRDSADALVHDSDVRHVLDLLRASGAAALSVNDQRIVNSSYVFCIGPTILCNMQRLTPPYVIQAIGDPQLMADAIRKDPMLSLRQTPEIGLIVQVEQQGEQTCPAFAEADDLDKYIDRLEVPAA